MIEPSSREQASVVFLGRSSFRMETAGAAPIANELAIPARASDIPTERIFRSKEVGTSEPVAASVTGVRPLRSASNGALVGFGLMTFAFGSLLTSAVTRSYVWSGTDRKAEVAPAQAPPPSVARTTEPIVVAVVPPVPESPPPARAASKPKRAARLTRGRSVGAGRTKPQIEVLGPKAPEAADVASPTAKTWVDPFAD